MKLIDLDNVLIEIRRFQRAAIELQNASPETVHHGEHFVSAPREQGTLRRSSLDLTRALAKLRRGGE